jgi:hypothetical protein
MTTRQFLGVTAIRFHPVTRFAGNQRRRYHLTIHTQRCELPVEHVPGWPGLVTGPELLHRPQFPDQFADRFEPVRNHSQRTDFSRFSYGDGNRFGMDIESNKA